MRAIQFDASIPRYLFGMAVRNVYPPLLWSGLSCVYMADVPEPPLPADDWVVVRTRLSGICGTDLGAVHLHTSPYYTPLTSSPFTMGHEIVGTIEKVGAEADGWQERERVVIEPLLWCRPRGLQELCKRCQRGEINRCERLTEGLLEPGVIIGGCRSTGGGWSSHFVAHTSQLYRVPDTISDENAVLVEPFAVGLHAALQNWPDDENTVLIIGAGTIGLCTLAALRGLGSEARIIVSARYPFQAEAAQRLGAAEVISTSNGDLYEQVAQRTGARLLDAMIGKRVVMGGADLTFLCAGNDSTLDDALRLTHSGGRVLIVNMPAIAKGVDWSAIFAQELEVHAANTYHHTEVFRGERWNTFDLALDLMARGEVDLGWMVTHHYKLEDYKQALGDLTRRRDEPAIKAVFEPEPRPASVTRSRSPASQ